MILCTSRAPKKTPGGNCFTASSVLLARHFHVLTILQLWAATSFQRHAFKSYPAYRRCFDSLLYFLTDSLRLYSTDESFIFKCFLVCFDVFMTLKAFKPHHRFPLSLIFYIRAVDIARGYFRSCSCRIAPAVCLRAYLGKHYNKI